MAKNKTSATTSNPALRERAKAVRGKTKKALTAAATGRVGLSVDDAADETARLRASAVARAVASRQRKTLESTRPRRATVEIADDEARALRTTAHKRAQAKKRVGALTKEATRLRSRAHGSSS